jgi:hypothetical protein
MVRSNSGILFIAIGLGLWLLLGLSFQTVAASDFMPIAPDKLNQVSRDKAQQVATDLLAGWRDGKFRKLTGDFTTEMIAKLPPEDQKKAYDALRSLFGDFRSLKFVEAASSPQIPGYTAYRFKGTFSAVEANPEVRVMLDGEGKVAGFWVRHWMDEIQ